MSKLGPTFLLFLQTVPSYNLSGSQLSVVSILKSLSASLVICPQATTTSHL